MTSYYKSNYPNINKEKIKIKEKNKIIFFGCKKSGHCKIWWLEIMKKLKIPRLYTLIKFIVGTSGYIGWLVEAEGEYGLCLKIVTIPTSSQIQS